MSATNDAILLRINKQDQVRALQDLGFTNVTNNTPLSEIAEYIRWAGGLRDLRIACVHIKQSGVPSCIVLHVLEVCAIPTEFECIATRRTDTVCGCDNELSFTSTDIHTYLAILRFSIGRHGVPVLANEVVDASIGYFYTG